MPTSTNLFRTAEILACGAAGIQIVMFVVPFVDQPALLLWWAIAMWACVPFVVAALVVATRNLRAIDHESGSRFALTMGLCTTALGLIMLVDSNVAPMNLATIVGVVAIGVSTRNPEMRLSLPSFAAATMAMLAIYSSGALALAAALLLLAALLVHIAAAIVRDRERGQAHV